MASYLVTGAAGMIGARVAGHLLDEGHAVVGVDDLNDSYDPRLKLHRLEGVTARRGFEFLQLDVVDAAAMKDLARRAQPFDAVINLAARPGVRYSVDHPDIYLATNVHGTLNLLEFCRRGDVPKFVLASTSSLYGSHNPLPFVEDADTDHPISPYAASKKSAEVLSFTYHHLHGLDVTVLRYFTVYGPAGRPDMAVFRFVQRIREGRPIVVFGEGDQSRDFTFTDDIARGTVAGLRPLGFEIINLGSDHPYRVTELIERLEARLGRPAVIERQVRHVADVPATWASVEKADRLLGWRPTTSLDEGLARTVEWYEAQREWARTVETG